jgi:hypothetical protein
MKLKKLPIAEILLLRTGIEYLIEENNEVGHLLATDIRQAVPTQFDEWVVDCQKFYTIESKLIAKLDKLEKEIIRKISKI